MNQQNILDGAEFYLDFYTLPADENNKFAGESWRKDFKYMSFITQRTISDWTIVFIRDKNSKKVVDYEIKWIKLIRISLTADSKGFFFSKFDLPKKTMKISLAKILKNLPA